MAQSYIEQISPNAWIAGHRDAGAVITQQTDLDVQSDIGKIAKVKKQEIMTWGADNTLPSQRELLVRSNNVVAELVATKRDITLGQGMYAYKKKYDTDDKGKSKLIREEVEIPSKSADFFERVKIDRENLTAAGELFLHENLFTQFVCTKGLRLGEGKGEIESMKTKRCRHVRAGRQNSKGIVQKYYWAGSWDKKSRREEHKKAIPVAAFDPENMKGSFMLHTYDPLLFDDYYAHPKYWGAKTWISLANAIPLFHLNNLENGYNVRFHIEIPADYFKDTTTENQTDELKKEAIKAEKAARQEFLDTVNDFLAGIENAGRALFTEYYYSENLSKEYPGIKINAINFDMKDEALIKLFDASNTAVVSSQGVHPTLAAISQAGKLSSGSEMRNAYNIYLAVKTPAPRKLLLERIYLAKLIEAWDKEVFYGFRDIEIAKLDEEKRGKKESTEKNTD